MTDKIIDAINQCKTRDEVVPHYKNSLNISGIDYTKLNDAIIKKWSISGLKYIKMLMWTKEE